MIIIDMKYLSFFIVFIVFSTLSFGSDCSKTSKNELFRSADFVFIGEVIYVDESSYIIKVNEKFKGNPKDTVEGVISHSSIRPEKGSNWLMYSSKIDENKIFTDFCSGSRSFEIPFGAHDYSYPKPPPRYLKDPSQFFLFENITHDMALNELYFDISNLRQKKLEGLLTNLVADNKDLKNQLLQTNQYYKLILVLVGLIIVLQVFVNVRQFRK